MSTTENLDDALKGEYKEKRAESIAEVNKDLSNIFKDSTLLVGFLNLLSHFKDYSVRDIVFIAKKCPNATLLHTYDDWNKKGYRINKGEKGFALPDFKHEEEKFVFDIKQTKAPPQGINVDTRPLKDKMRALLSNNSTRIGTTKNSELTNGQAVYYDNRYNMIIIDETKPVEEIYEQLTVELAHAEFAHKDTTYHRDNYSTLAEMVGYVICKNNDVSFSHAINIAKGYKNLDSNSTLTKLELVKETSLSLQDNINYFYNNGKERQERYKPPTKNTVKATAEKIVTDDTASPQTKAKEAPPDDSLDKKTTIIDYLKQFKNQKSDNTSTELHKSDSSKKEMTENVKQ